MTRARPSDIRDPPSVCPSSLFLVVRDSADRRRPHEKCQLRVIIGQITARITSFPHVDGIRGRDPHDVTRARARTQKRRTIASE